MRSLAAGLVLGTAADELLGDPRRAHPVAAFGRVAGVLERRCYADDRAHGAVFAALAVAPLVLAAHSVDRGARRHPVAHTVLIALATWTVLGGCSLRRVGAELAGHLAARDLDAARDLLPSLCGRDPAGLDATGLARAGIESLAENTSDAAVAPLLAGAVFGLPGLLGYRAVNTLDAMVGHRSPRYARFGTASARLDDVANLLPARVEGLLTLAAAPVVRGSGRQGWTSWRAGAAQHPSPNAGVCEASAAGVLGVRLGGTTVYGTRVEQRPQLGPDREPGPQDLRRAIRLSRAVQLGAVLVAVAVAGWRR